MKTSHLVLVVTTTAIALISACSQSNDDTARFRVALVTPGPVSDAGWNAAAFEGLQQISHTLDAHTAHMEASNPGEFEEAFRDFARRSYDVVFGHGFEFQDAALAASSDHPETAFVITSSLTVAPRVAGLVFRLEEAAYLAGVLAGHRSSSGIAAMVGGMEIPPVRLVFEGFERGFLAARPDGTVKDVYIGSWEDIASARQATLSLIEQGADVLIHNADAAGLGVFQACRERGVEAYGTNRDQSGVAPEVVVASAVMDVPQAMLDVARLVEAGSFIGQVYSFDLASGIVELTINPAFSDEISAEQRAALAAARADLIADAIALEHFDQ